MKPGNWCVCFKLRLRREVLNAFSRILTLLGAAFLVSSCTLEARLEDLSSTAGVSTPVITISSTLTSPVSTPLLTYTVNLPWVPTGFAVEDINVTNGTVQNFSGTGTSYSFEVVPLAEGVVSVVINAGVFTDALGVGNPASNTLDLVYEIPRWSQQAYIKAANADAGDYFGDAVSLSGDTVAVGVMGEDSNQIVISNDTTASGDNSALDAGAVYVYRRSGLNWAPEAYIKAVNAEAGDGFGDVLSISGDTLVVGARQEDSSQMVISNDATASGDNGAGSSGAVYVYRRTGSAWAQEAYIKAANAQASDNFGEAVALSGDTLVVGASDEDSNESVITNGTTASGNNDLPFAGAAYVYRRSGTSWFQEAYIKAVNSGSTDGFGASVAVSGDTVAVAALSEDSNQTVITNGPGANPDNTLFTSGAVYVYRRNGATWSQEAFIKAANADSMDHFGYSISISGDTLVVSTPFESSAQTIITNGPGASLDNTASMAGAAYVYRRSGVTWAQEAYIKAVNGQANDQFGTEVSINGDTLVVSAYGEDSNQTTITNGSTASNDESAIDSGALYVYRRSGITWTQQAYIKPANAGSASWRVGSPSISGNTIAMGSPGDASNQTVVTNGSTTSTDTSRPDSGAVFIYTYGPGFSSVNRLTRVDIDYSHVRTTGENTTVYVEYSDDNSSWTTAKSQVLIPSVRRTYTMAWDDKGVHRYWRLRFVDPDDATIGGGDELFEVSFYQLNDVEVSPSVATRISTHFSSSANAEDMNTATSAVWDGSASGEISWDFGP